ncbi:thiamine pyrophosphate enzyme, central domain-containing protein [Ditylenchus destructor]|nr:thiamine pyrophosphate enzyme, central domain-containing protein [Ditylenchus destructor]
MNATLPAQLQPPDEAPTAFDPELEIAVAIPVAIRCWTRWWLAASTRVFGYPGGAVLPLYDALYAEPRLRHVLVRHEQAAVHAAEGYARSTGRRGGGAGDLRPGGEQHDDGAAGRAVRLHSHPVHQRPGQQRGDRHRRLPGMRRAGDLAAGAPNGTRSCDRAATSRRWCARGWRSPEVAARVGAAGRAQGCAARVAAGPGGEGEGQDLVDEQAGGGAAAPGRGPPRADADGHPTAGGSAGHRAGGRLDRGGAASGVLWGRRADPNAARTRARSSRRSSTRQAPCTLTLMGWAPVCRRHPPSWLGMLGMHGTLEANLAMHHADLIVWGGRAFRRPGDGSAGQLRAGRASDPSGHRSGADRQGASRRPGAVRRCGHSAAEAASRAGASRDADGAARRLVVAHRGLAGAAFCWTSRTRRRRRDRLDRRGAASDVGGSAFGLRASGRWLTSGGAGTMGYGVPAAIGAQIAHPDKTVVLCNNGYMGMVRQWQELIHGGRYSHSYNASLPDFVALARAFGWGARRVERRGKFWRGRSPNPLASDGPFFLDVAVTPGEKMLPDDPGGEGASGGDVAPPGARAPVSCRLSAGS